MKYDSTKKETQPNTNEATPWLTLTMGVLINTLWPLFLIRTIRESFLVITVLTTPTATYTGGIMVAAPVLLLVHTGMLLFVSV